jgi:DNA-directed RNA polymerase subunit RPC12/RpoP
MKLAVVALFLTAFPDDTAVDFHQDFRGQPYAAKSFRTLGPERSTRIKSEPEGLRITLPAEQKSPEHVGLATTFTIKGDFEITLRYEILHADPPVTGNGVGLEFYVITDTPTTEALGFYRLRRVKEGDVYMFTRATTTDEGKRRNTHKFKPSTVKAGQLRLTRAGTEAVYWAADGDEAEFRELHRTQLGAEDVKTVMLTAFPGKDQSAVDLRLIEFRVRAGDLFANTEVLPPSSRGPLFWALAGVAGAVLILGGLWALWRRSRPRPQAQALAPNTGEESRHVSPDVSFPCGSCGKNLKAKPEFAGKNVKCPQCGETMLVPVS